MHRDNALTGPRARFDWSRAKAATLEVAHEEAPDDLARLFETRAEELARASRGAAVRTGMPHLRFSVGPASFALALAEIDVVVRPTWITRVPCATPPVDRVFQHAGKLVAVLDLGSAAGTDAGPTKRSGVVIVLAGAASGLGIEPTAVEGLVDIEDSTLHRAETTTDLGISRGVTPDLTIVLTASGLAERARAHIHPSAQLGRQS